MSRVTEQGEEKNDITPEEDDVSMCFACGKFAVFHDGELRRPTRSELVEIGFDERCRAMRLAWADVHDDP